MQIHVVRPGETLFSVAAGYRLSPALLAGMNGVRPDAQLAVGQTLVARSPAVVHTVAPGDTVYAVARRYGTDVRALYRNNVTLSAQSVLRPGEQLVVSFADDARIGAIGANGYAYPYVGAALLDTALPYLSALTPFTYGIGVDGALLPLSDGALLASAARFGCAALMHLSSLTEEGGFSNERSSRVLNSPALRERLIRDVIETLRQKGYAGLDVDFEFVFPQERELYAAFVRALRERLNPLGYPVLVALAPKTRANQPGLLYVGVT